LRNEADAEDAFQATFVSLAADARRIRRPAALAGWLHSVAWRVSAKARRTRERRRLREARVQTRFDAPPIDLSWGEVREAIHEELSHLPKRFREAIVLFYLAGQTQDEVGQALGLSTAGAKRRLERGREILRTALDRRGFGPTVALAAAAITLPTTSAAQTACVAELAVKYLTDRSTVPSAVLSLVSTGVQPMTAKLMIGTVAFLGVTTAVGLGAFRPGAGGQPAPDDNDPAVAQVKEDPFGPPQKGKASPKGPFKSPPKGFTSPALEQFRELDPAERLKFVEKAAGKENPFTAAKVGDITAVIVERGSIEPALSIDVVCKVKSKSPITAPTIKWLIDDGSVVKKGDRIAELDGAGIKDQIAVETVRVKEAEAARTLAAENLDLIKKENEIETRLAAIDVKLAEIELKDPPKDKSKEVLALKVEQAQLKLERVQARAKAQVALAETELRAKHTALEIAVKRQENYVADLKECVLTAPLDGFVVHYAGSTGRFGPSLIAPGEPVREGQKLLQISDFKQFVIEARVHEAQISRVRSGQAVQVRVDAFPSKVLTGKVTHISPMPAKTNWNSADVKVYPVKIAIEDPPAGLKPSMTAEVHITTGEQKGALHVPIKAIMGVGRDRVCFVKSGNELVERKIVIGMSNAEVVEIKEGLKEGDQILTDLTPVLGRP
jgi:RND family efflux transporter MFP subunit